MYVVITTTCCHNSLRLLLNKKDTIKVLYCSKIKNISPATNKNLFNGAVEKGNNIYNRNMQ